MMLATWLSRREWREGEYEGSWWLDAVASRGHVWVCVLGLEVTVTWGTG